MCVFLHAMYVFVFCTQSFWARLPHHVLESRTFSIEHDNNNLCSHTKIHAWIHIKDILESVNKFSISENMGYIIIYNNM